jgi:glycosyltransferase involved in cell wall biosynthesis
MNFSIITLTLNSKKTLIKTINSVLSQIGPDDEYLIIDGGSKDGTLQYLESIKNKQIKIFKNINYKIYGSLNFAIKNSKNEIIGIIHSDDYYDRKVLFEVRKRFIENKNTDIVYGKLSKIYQNKTKIFSVNSYITKSKIIEMLNHVHPTVFVKKKIYNGILFDEKYRLAADMDFFLKLSKTNMNIEFIDQVIAFQMYGGASDLNRFKIAVENLKIYANHGLYLKGIINFIYLLLKNFKITLRNYVS